MTHSAVQRMTADEFRPWRLDREGAWERVDGEPGLKSDNGPEMLAGGRRNHAYVAAGRLFALERRLRGGPCKPAASDLAVRMARGDIRQPDVTVECGQGGGGDLQATQPRAPFEVLSPASA